MSDLVAFGTASRLPSRLERQTNRALSQIAARQEVMLAEEQAKVDLVTSVCESSLIGASHIATVEALLVARTPHAEARLNHIASAGTAGLANIVLRASQRCR